MQNHVWADLARQIPSTIQDKLMLVTTSGTEIAIQAFLRIDREFMVVKGRLSGSQEMGRVFFIPYTQIDYLGSMNPLKDTEYEDLFGGIVLANEAQAVPDTRQDTRPDSTLPPAPTPAPASGMSSPSSISYPSLPSGGSGPRPVVRSAVLERFRARSSNASGTPSPRPDE